MLEHEHDERVTLLERDHREASFLSSHQELLGILPDRRPGSARKLERQPPFGGRDFYVEWIDDRRVVDGFSLAVDERGAERARPFTEPSENQAKLRDELVAGERRAPPIAHGLMRTLAVRSSAARSTCTRCERRKLSTSSCSARRARRVMISSLNLRRRSGSGTLSSGKRSSSRIT